MEKRKPKIFISYAREDSKGAESLYNDLSNHGCEPWMDTHDISAGENWKKAIKEAIRECDFFIAFLWLYVVWCG